MKIDQTIETAMSLVNELKKTQKYLLSGACPEQAEPILIANQTNLLEDLTQHFKESLELLNMPQQKPVPTPTHQCKSCYKPAWHQNTDMDVCPSCGGDLKSFED
ncbi:hypothetical protein ACU5B6_25900 [Moritella viscosa]|uniref:hypothetical protein n=1 Tax=Moritella viscosa TaxID=80854 RepID=UPI0009155499|nr:hypothetical protein [Moritella viscosa]SHO15296.1 Putative uncharacterized protein [Moritella viscosa]